MKRLKPDLKKKKLDKEWQNERAKQRLWQQKNMLELERESEKGNHKNQKKLRRSKRKFDGSFPGVKAS